MIFGLFRRSANQRVIDRLHGEIMAAVRQPTLYADYGVPDTFEGRFEILALVSTLVVRRLATLPSPGPEIAQDLTDKIFSEIDAAMREMGVGDLAVPKRIKKLAAAFLGRRQAYEASLTGPDPVQLRAALARNVYGCEDPFEAQHVDRLARYCRMLERALSDAPIAAFVEGPAPFPQAEAVS